VLLGTTDQLPVLVLCYNNLRIYIVIQKNFTILQKMRCPNCGNQSSWRDPSCNKCDSILHQKNRKTRHLIVNAMKLTSSLGMMKNPKNDLM